MSLQVRTLEEEFGVALFERKGPRIALTRVGELLYESALPLVQGVLRLPALFAEAHYGTRARWLRIGAGQISAAYLLPEPLKRFVERCPGIRVEVRTGTGRERLEWLRTFELDAVVGVVDAAAPGVEFYPVRTTRMVLVTPLDHPLAGQGPVAPAALARHRLIAPVSDRGARRMQDALLHLHGITPRVLVEVDGWGAILNYVAAGAGIAFVPDMCVTASEPVATVAVKARAVQRTYGIAVRSGGLMSQVTRRLHRDARLGGARRGRDAVSDAYERPRIRDKRDRLRQLRAFCETVRRGSVARAAERLGVTEPAVSLHVRALERELGAALLEGDPSGVAPTPAGERCYALADPLVRGTDSLFGDFARHLDLDSRGEVRIAATTAAASFVLPSYVKRFQDAHPRVPVRMDTVAGVRAGVERLVDGEADLALGPKEPFPEATLSYHELLTYRIVLIVPPGHPLAGRASVSVQQAAAFPAVVPPPEAYSRQHGETAARALDVDVNVVVEVRGWGTLKRYVEAGFGIGVVPSLVVTRSDRLAVVALELDEPPRSFGVFARTDRHLTPAARRFLQVLLPDASGPAACSGQSTGSR